MATPQESVTTVDGRRCTRTRVRTAVTSTFATEVAQEVAQVTVNDFTPAPSPNDVQAAQIQTSAGPPPPPETTEAAPAATTPPPPPPPPAPSPEPVPEQAAEEPTEEAEPLATSASPAPPAASRSAPFANIAPTPPVAAAPGPVALVSDSESSETEAAVLPSPTGAAATPTPAVPASSGTGASLSSGTSALSRSLTPARSTMEAILEEPQRSTQPNLGPAPTLGSDPSGDSSGMIGPNSDTGEGPNLTISRTSEVGSIVGGVIGGFAGLAFISILLFLCLRRRRAREPFAKWPKPVSEKEEGKSGFLDKIGEASASLKAIPAHIGAFLVAMRRKLVGPSRQRYGRQSVRSSLSSVYTGSAPNRGSRSMSEPPSRLREQLGALGGRFGDRMPSLKRSRTLLQKKQDSLVIGAQSPFPGIVDDPVTRHSNGVENPFADPDPEQNPRQSTSKVPRNWDGLNDQQRPPITPKPAAFSNTSSRDPFASILDELEESRGNRTPDWLRETAHKRTQSATTALRSHPPSTYTASIYTTADNPFLDPSEVPPVPRQPLPPDPPKRPLNAYTAALPTFNATSSTTSRDSMGSFYFGEPGPSRPTTNMFSDISTVSAVPKRGRESDPFDLDRPEVLGFGHVGGRQVRASVTRQNSKTNRTSSVPNWVNLEGGLYGRSTAAPGS